MNIKRRVLVTMFIFSMLIHLLLAAAWSAHQLYSVQNMINIAPRAFTVVKSTELPRVQQTLPEQRVQVKVPTTVRQLQRENTISEVLPNTTPSLSASSTVPNLRQPIKSDITLADANVPMGPFLTEIDPKKAWINVAESIDYSLLQGISMDISDGEYRLQNDLDKRVRAMGNLTIEYPLIAAALGKEAVVYVLLLIDEEGKKSRMQVVHGDADFSNAVLQALDKVEFRPGVLRDKPVRSIMLLEFEFRRDPPKSGSF
jgi:outer membrane biosynthesis protein TonB